jgi:hypothetical protein
MEDNMEETEKKAKFNIGETLRVTKEHNEKFAHIGFPESLGVVERVYTSQARDGVKGFWYTIQPEGKPHNKIHADERVLQRVADL